MKKLLALLMMLLPCSSFATTTVTGTLQNLGTGTVGQAAFVRFWLRGCGGNIPRINGTAVIAPSQGGVYFFDLSASSIGAVSGTLYSTRDSTGLLAGEIECGGSKLSVWYGMQVFVGGKGGSEVPLHAKNGVVLDLSSATPISVTPVVPAPTGDSTYCRIDGGNGCFSSKVKPTLPGDAIQYVSVNGSDLNDGLSWGSAKATIYGAMIALPGGNAIGPFAGTGTIYAGANSKAHPTTGVGIWLMGSGDPNYAVPPAGWVKCNACSIQLEGVGTASVGALPNQLPNVPVVGGSSTDRNHPALWLSGINQNFIAHNISFSGAQRVIVAGECSNNSRTTLGCQIYGLTLDNVNATVAKINASSGPAFDAPYATSVRVKNSSFTGNTVLAGFAADNAACILYGTSSSPTGTMVLEDVEMYTGGVKVLGNGQTNLYAFNVDEYGDNVNNIPPVIWFTNWNNLSEGLLINATGNYINAGGGQPNSIQVDSVSSGIAGPVIMGGQSSASVKGPATLFLTTPYFYQQAINNAMFQTKTGFINNYLFAESNIARRLAGPVPIRATNQAYANPSSYTSAGNVVTTGQADPFGTSQAVKAHSNFGILIAQSLLLSSAVAYTPTSGDWIVGGYWAKETSITTGYIGARPVINMGTATFTTVKQMRGPDRGDGGEWAWHYIANKVTATSAVTTVQLYISYGLEEDVTVYGPVFNIIPVGTMSDAEALWYAQSMNSYDTTCAIGQFCGPTGHPLVVNTPVINGAATGTGVQGTDTKLLTSGTVSGTGATLCTDANGGATTAACAANPVVIQASNITYLGGTVTLTANTLTTVMTKVVTMPSTGCPCRVFVAYGMNLGSASSELIQSDVSDGTNRFAMSGAAEPGSFSYSGISGSAFSTVTYANNAVITFTLEIEDNNNGMSVVVAPQFAGFQNTWLGTTVMTSN